MIILQQQNPLIICACIKKFSSPLMLRPREKDRVRTLTLLIYGFILITVDLADVHAAENIRDQGTDAQACSLTQSCAQELMLVYLNRKNTDVLLLNTISFDILTIIVNKST